MFGLFFLAAAKKVKHLPTFPLGGKNLGNGGQNQVPPPLPLYDVIGGGEKGNSTHSI